MGKEQYVSYETAELLKEKGFDWECNHYYMEKVSSDEHYLLPGSIMYGENYNKRLKLNEVNVNISSGKISAPTQQMAMAWLREEYYIDVLPLVRHVNKFAGELPIKEYSYRIYDSEGNVRVSSRDWFRAYEKSIESALVYALKNLI